MRTGKQLISVGVLAIVAGAAWAAPQPAGLQNPFADTVNDGDTRGPVSPTPANEGDPQGQPPPGTPSVPLPSAALLGAAGLGVLGGIYRRRNAR